MHNNYSNKQSYKYWQKAVENNTNNNTTKNKPSKDSLENIAQTLL
jgi:hypothetical protein